MTTHNVDINVSANTKEAEKSLTYLQSMMGEFGKQATNRLAGMLGAAAVAKMAFDKVTQAISANIATAKQVSQMAIKFNIDPRSMHSITMAAKDAGVSVRALTMSMKHLGQYAGKAMSSKDLQANFKQLGIEASKLNEIQAAPSKFLPEIAQALMKIGDENQRAAAMASFLGRQYQALAPIVEELGTSAEARQKFLNNENAMTEDQIAANKEIAQIQNDLSDGFEKMVAAASPLLLWAMGFVNLLAQGLGFIKDMIFETDKAAKSRITKGAAKFGRTIASHASNLKKGEEAARLKGVVAEGGTLTEDEQQFLQEYEMSPEKLAEIEGAGGRKEYLKKQLEMMQKYAEFTEASSNLQGGGIFPNPANGLDFNERQEEVGKLLTPELREFMKSDFFKETLGRKKKEGESDADFVKRQNKALDELMYAYGKGDLTRLAEAVDTDEVGSVSLKMQDKAFEAENEVQKAEMKRYREIRKSKAFLRGNAYDEATDKEMSKTQYKELLKKRGKTDKEADAAVEAYEDEVGRKRLEKQERRGERILGASERKLFDQQGNVRMGLNDEEQAQDALNDQIEVRNEAYEDLAEQLEVTTTLERQLLDLQQDEKKNAAEILSKQATLRQEQIKKNELQAKFNNAVGQEARAMEALKKAKEKMYLEEQKREDKVKARIKAEEDFDKQMKYKLMKAEGRSAKDIDEEKLKDDEAEYYKMLEEYQKEFKKAMTNPHTGDKGEPLSDAEKERLEGLTKGLDEQSRKVLESAFNLGNRESSGQVTTMRRIGGGGLEYGGVANTAKLQLDEAKKAVKNLEEIKGVLKNPRSVSVHSGEPRQEGKVYAEVMPDIN